MLTPHWTTPSQRAWLEDRIPAFTKAQENGLMTKVFYPDRYAAWDRAFNSEPPSEIELKEAGGDLEMARSIKKKFMETVSFISQVRL